MIANPEQQIKLYHPAVVGPVASAIVLFAWFIQEPGFEPLSSIIAIIAGAFGIGSPLFFRHKSFPHYQEWLISATMLGLAILGSAYLLVTPGIEVQIIPNKNTIAPGETITLQAQLAPVDNRGYAVIWSTTQGDFPAGNQGQKVLFQAPTNPASGFATVTVHVFDGDALILEETVRIVVQ